MTTASMTQTNKGLHIGLWVVQALLGLAFLAAGSWKLTTPIDELAKQLPWVVGMSGLVRFIGLSEFLGGLGMILPAATRIKPGLTALAGLGLVVVMILAALFHISRGEFEGVPVNLVLGGLAAFVAWGRWKASPISPRS